MLRACFEGVKRFSTAREASVYGEIEQFPFRHPHEDPLGQEGGAERFVETDRGLVPVEHAPLEAPTAALEREAREACEQRLPDARPAMLGLDEDIPETAPRLA